LLKDGCMLGKVKNRGCGVEEKLFCFWIIMADKVSLISKKI
jgi:hypothetical protein